MTNSPSTRMAEARMAEFQALLTEEEIALGIAEYEEMFGEVPHFLSIESLDAEAYAAVGLIRIERDVVEGLFGHPRLSQRVYEHDGPDIFGRFVVLEVLAESEGCVLDEFRPFPPNPPINLRREGEA